MITFGPDFGDQAIGVLCGAWLAPQTYQAVCDTRRLIRYLRRRRGSLTRIGNPSYRREPAVAEQMSEQERIARGAGLFMQMLKEMPTERDSWAHTPEELADMEAAGQARQAEMRAVLFPAE